MTTWSKVWARHNEIRLPYTLFLIEIEVEKQQKERNSRHSNAILRPAMRRPSLLISAGEELFASFFSRQEVQRLSRLFRWERQGTSKFTADFRQCLSTTQALATTWDSPHLGDDLPLLAPQLRIIAHCGGEVKSRFLAIPVQTADHHQRSRSFPSLRGKRGGTQKLQTLILPSRISRAGFGRTTYD